MNPWVLPCQLIVCENCYLELISNWKLKDQKIIEDYSWEKFILGEKILTKREKIFFNEKKYYLVSNILF